MGSAMKPFMQDRERGEEVFLETEYLYSIQHLEDEITTDKLSFFT